MPTRSSLRPLLLVLVAGVLTPLPLRAGDFAVVLHPGTRLAPDGDAFPQGKQDFRDSVGNYGIDDLVVVGGKSAGDAPGSSSFVLLLENPRTAGYSGVETGTPEGGDKARRFPYKEVDVVVPFSLWHRAAPGAEPVLLGRSLTWGYASQLEDRGRDGMYTKFRVVDRSTDEMVRMAVREQMEGLPGLLVDAWSPGVVHQAPRPSVTAARVLELLRQSRSDAAAAVISSSVPVRITYRPSRVVKGPDGRAVVEVDLWNRLPVRARGAIECRQARLVYPDMPARLEEVDAARRQNEARRHSVTCEFDLAPGQKDVARFVIPAEAGTDPRLFRDDEITVADNPSALGEPKRDRSKSKGGRQKKRNK